MSWSPISIHAPLSDEDQIHLYAVDKFDAWMQIQPSQNKSHSEQLLYWLDYYCFLKEYQSYSGFLKLSQAVSNRGYKTTLDIPISEEEYKSCT